ncbi:UDP-glucuronosyl/UDP-glucosyltransferase protein [Dioscorea alata]|uniref:UDP-glucuronosyl/UDP-glucosyltransferase protein n=1 Tax=Dioscorea alata TaxID=55571 RepID=A0ACB7TXM7_DIOAL|nr:UDP-glucuronosyl/UDP-glucosyltransferase protein [Dioscorea alata]
MMSSNIKGEHKGHAVLIPYPAQGHITPLLKFAKLLHSSGFQITFVNTEYNHRRLLKSRGYSSLHLLEDFIFEKFPDGLTPSDEDTTQDIPSLCASLAVNCSSPFKDLIRRLSSPVTVIVSDVYMGFTSEAAEQFKIPLALFWTASACGFMGYWHYRDLIERGLIPLKDESDLTNGYLETKLDWMVGVKNMRLKDLPTFIRTTDINDIVLNYVLRDLERIPKASAFIINTVKDIDLQILQTMSSILTMPVYPIGPLSLLTRKLPESPLSSIGSNLWKEDMSCLEWLEGKEASSVVYVNFGSITVMTNKQMVEFAWGLANSGHDFLWVIRPDLVRGDNAVLPQEFLTKTQGRRKLTSWCPQEEVLMHEAIGGFLTHGGWNSILESICGGVPMLCWPFFAEQQTNCRHVSCEWGIGMEIDEHVERDDVERLIRELMSGEKGKEMKCKVVKLKEFAWRACEDGGSSLLEMESLVNDLIKLNN